MSLSSKQTLVQFRGESTKQLPLTNAPRGWTTQHIVTKTTEVSPEVLRTVHKELDDIKGLPKRDELNEKKKQLLL